MPPPRHPDPDLDRIARLVRVRAAQHARIDAQVADAVRQARAHGRTWAEVGRALGTSAQAAHQRYARGEEPDDHAQAPPSDAHL